MRHSRALAVVGVAAITAAGLVACAPGAGDQEEPTELSIAVPSGHFMVDFEPNAGIGTWYTPSQAVYDPLVKLDPETNTYVPWLAKEYEISEDGLTMTLMLRDDVDFIDGEHMTADGVADTFNHYFLAETGYFPAIAGPYEAVAEAIDEYTLEIRTAIPIYSDGLFILVLGLFPIVSPAAYLDAESLATTPVGTGPYILDEVVPEVSATFVRNPDYWNPEAYPFDTVSVNAFADKVAALNALKSGQINATEIEFGMAAETESAGFRLNEGVGGFFGMLFTDREGERFPAFGDVRVRQAIAYAFDRATISEEIEFGFSTTSTQPFRSNSREYVEGGDDRYSYDPQKARELLAEAGYADGLVLPLPDQTGGTSSVDYRPVVEQYLADIGVTVEWIDPDQDGTLVSELGVPAFVGGQLYEQSIELFNLRCCGADQPVSDPEFQEMLAPYGTGSPADREEVQPRLAEYILEQAWWVPITHPKVLWATTEEIVASPRAWPNLDMFELAE